MKNFFFYQKNKITQFTHEEASQFNRKPVWHEVIILHQKTHSTYQSFYLLPRALLILNQYLGYIITPQNTFNYSIL